VLCLCVMELAAQVREEKGRKVRSLRREGLIPAELYGHGLENKHLAVRVREFGKVFKEAGKNTLLTLSLEGEKRPVLIHEVQRDYISNDIAHVDFYQVSMKEEIKAKIPLEFLGESPAVKGQGGVLNKAITEIEVQALPDHLPHRLSVSLDALTELNASFYVKDLVVPKGVKILVEPETVLVTVTPPRVEEVEVTAPVDLSAIKVEDEEKKVKRVADKESAEE